MIKIKFEGNTRFPKKEVAFYDGLDLLSRIEDQVIAEEHTETVQIKIYIQRDKSINRKHPDFSSELPLGQEYGYELIGFIESKLREYYGDDDERVYVFIELLLDEVKEARSNRSETKPTKVARPSVPPTPVSRKQRKWPLIVGVSVLVILLITGGGFLAFQHFSTAATDPLTSGTETIESTTSQEPVEEQVAKALKTEEPGKVAEEFSDQLPLIANLLTQDQRFDDLEKFNEQYPTPEGTFDLAFHKEDWKQVITLNDSQLTPERQAMLVYAYVQLGQMEEAEILNKTLKSDKLTEEIQRGWKVAAVKAIQKADFKKAETIQKKISDPDIKELIDVGKTCQEMIELYSKKKDNENKKIWQDRLAGLGKEFIDSGE